ncbi:MAG: hypothetical protein HZA08_13530 [Nitrospirae bacterium]|nr:hypothetical protein [Nitrospirota bacterium]
MSLRITKGHENQRDKNVPPILVDRDRRGFLTPPEGISDELHCRLQNLIHGLNINELHVFSKFLRQFF